MGMVKNYLRKHERLEFILKKLYFGMHDKLERFIPSPLFLQCQYFLKTGERLNLNNPQTFNEKIQWLKLHYHDPLLNRCVDKWEVRDFVRERGLQHILIPAWGPFDTVDQMNAEMLPNAFILKLTNGSSFNFICKNRRDFNHSLAKEKFDSWMRVNFYAARREWAYKDVKNRIMCEQLLCTQEGGLPSDIRFFCFNGEPRVIAVDLDSVVDGVKTSNYFRHLYTCQWEPIEATIQYPKKSNYEVERPENLEDLLMIAKTLSAGFPFVRVDLYNVSGKPYFGELTFYHASGYQKIMPVSFRIELGNSISLRKC
ncbi:MAG: glycosyltransferase [Gammaproteobacteria bacterium]|nr:glycosyltransferase [Gammaproteobacteria bacterium]